METFKFPRVELAKSIADEMQGAAMFGHFANLPASGTFLSAPRRVGKSTFLREDLIPALEKSGHVVIYVDLWSDKSVDPAELLRQSLINALLSRESRIKKTTRAIGLSKITALATLSFDLNTSKDNKSQTLTDILTKLANKAKSKRVVLIVDEAQQALATETGEIAMFALKAARDALNADPSNFRLLLLCTGSSRSKLSGLVSGKESPFFGARVVDFPVLGNDFIEAYASFVNKRLNRTMQFDAPTMSKAFSLLNHRPELLFQVTGAAVAQSMLGKTKPNTSSKINEISRVLLNQAKAQKADTMREISEQFNALPLVQQAVLLSMIDEQEAFAPFTKASLATYAQHTGEKVSNTSVQGALESLVTKDIAWQAKRGGYLLDDPLWSLWRKNTTLQ
jgi:AAA domain